MTTSKSNAAILVAAAFAVGSVLWLDAQKVPIAVGQETAEAVVVQTPPAPRIDYSAEVDRLVGRADASTATAFKRFEGEISRATATYAARSAAASSEAANWAGDYEVIGSIVLSLVSDRATGKDRAGEYLALHFDPLMIPVVSGLSREVNVTMARLDDDLRQISAQLATDLVALGPDDATNPSRVEVSVDLGHGLDDELRNLQIDAAGVGVAIAFDAAAVANTQFAASLSRRMSALSARQFAKPVARGATLMMFPAIDGAFPVGDVLAAAGLLWTAYDLKALQSEFREAVRGTAAGHLHEVGKLIKGNATTVASDRVIATEKLQADMGARALTSLNGEDNL